jgi:hypothetical protein
MNVEITNVVHIILEDRDVKIAKTDAGTKIDIPPGTVAIVIRVKNGEEKQG